MFLPSFFSSLENNDSNNDNILHPHYATYYLVSDRYIFYRRKIYAVLQMRTILYILSPIFFIELSLKAGLVFHVGKFGRGFSCMKRSAELSHSEGVEEAS